MKVVQINSVCGSGSTGKICVAISEHLSAKGIENYIFYTMGKSDYPLGVEYMSTFEVKIQALKAKLFGNYGFQSNAATKLLIKKLEEVSPDIVHLHNLHGHNVHLGLLFSYLKEKQIKIFWTFHDCFAFTSYCMYFDMVNCDKWIYGCEKCPQLKQYSCFFDRSKELYKKKQELFSGLDMMIVTPSYWLSDLVKKSFLKDYPVKVIHNGIDLRVFTPKKSNFREKRGISKDKKVLLGVANKWEKRKGLDVFLNLAEKLDSNRFQIVLVGTDDEVDKKLPKGIISIHRTANQNELAEIYTAADYFINPTFEDNFPTVNIESLACGTPVITFDSGGSAEMLTKDCGISINRGDFDAIFSVLSNPNMPNFSSDSCVQRAQDFDKNIKFNEYSELYYSHEQS